MALCDKHLPVDVVFTRTVSLDAHAAVSLDAHAAVSLDAHAAVSLDAHSCDEEISMSLTHRLNIYSPKWHRSHFDVFMRALLQNSADI